VFQVVSTVVIVASTNVNTLAAANAERHPDSQRARIDRLIQTIRVVGAFKAAKADRVAKARGTERPRTVSVSEVKQELQRRQTLKDPEPSTPAMPPTKALWTRITSMACFRGFSALMIMSIAQWYLSVAIDFLLSGQPNDLQLGYGTTSIVLTTIFASGFAVWTHYTITKPSNKRIFDHFPKGGEVLIELWPITASWAVADHLCRSGPLALSRWFELKRFAFDASSWNTLDEAGQNRKILQFAVIALLYSVLVALISIPCTMITRRVHASMLSDEDLAIVPFHRGKKRQSYNFNQRSKIRRPGLTVSEAWATVTWNSYFHVLRLYLKYFIILQFIQIVYWSANWKLHEILDVAKYASTNLPCSPIAMVKPFNTRNTTMSMLGTTSTHAES